MDTHLDMGGGVIVLRTWDYIVNAFLPLAYKQYLVETPPSQLVHIPLFFFIVCVLVLDVDYHDSVSHSVLTGIQFLPSFFTTLYRAMMKHLDTYVLIL